MYHNLKWEDIRELKAKLNEFFFCMCNTCVSVWGRSSHYGGTCDFSKLQWRPSLKPLERSRQGLPTTVVFGGRSGFNDFFFVFFSLFFLFVFCMWIFKNIKGGFYFFWMYTLILILLIIIFNKNYSSILQNQCPIHNGMCVQNY
jgi:hypothetical protein